MSRSELRQLDLAVHQRVKGRSVEALPAAGYEEDPPVVDTATREEVPFYSTDRTSALHLADWAEDEAGWSFSDEEVSEDGTHRVTVRVGDAERDPISARGGDFPEAVARAVLEAAKTAGGA